MTKKYWKQLEAWAIGFKADLFISARLRLTAYYLLIMTSVLVAFSVVLYFSFAQILRENVDTQFPDVPDQGDQAVVQTMSDTKDGIVIIDLTAFALTIVLSYSLAGKTLEPIREAMEKQREFSANASHELRTPLAIMKTDSEVALRDINSNKAELKAVLESNLEEINRMTEMAGNLLKLSRVESGKEKKYFSELELGELTENIATRMKSRATQKGISIDIGKIDSGKVTGNKSDLDSVISNLIQNGIDYNKSEGTIRISVENDKEKMQLAVEDNGLGISENDLPHIFERFYKADKSHSRNLSNAGIGLSLVKEIVKKHGGSIRAQSALGKGTKIIVSLPFASA